MCFYATRRNKAVLSHELGHLLGFRALCQKRGIQVQAEDETHRVLQINGRKLLPNGLTLTYTRGLGRYLGASDEQYFRLRNNGVLFAPENREFLEGRKALMRDIARMIAAGPLLEGYLMRRQFKMGHGKDAQMLERMIGELVYLEKPMAEWAPGEGGRFESDLRQSLFQSTDQWIKTLDYPAVTRALGQLTQEAKNGKCQWMSAELEPLLASLMPSTSC
jgi:hypothetical protein